MVHLFTEMEVCVHKVTNHLKTEDKLILRQNRAVETWDTVYIGHSAIGYSAKSDIVPTSGWYQIPYTNNYWI